MEIPQNHIKVAKFIAGAIGIKPQVYPFWDNNNTYSIDILDLEDPLDNSIKFYCTIGVSDFPNLLKIKNGERNIPVEILFSAYSKYENAANILASSAFYLIKNKWYIQPGTVFKDIVSDYYPNIEMKHLLFTRPFFWQDKLSELKLDNNKNINWLFMLPISQKELEYKLNYNSNILEEKLFQENNIDVFDLDRKSVI